MLRLAGTETPPPRREVVEKVIAAPSPTPDVKPSTAKVTVSSTPPAAGEECPKCYSMTPWGKSNWCPECGYYPKAGFEGTGIDVTEDDLPPSLLRVIPEWAFPTVLGAVAILVGSITTRFVFHDELQRSLCGISQLVVCSLTLIAVHCRAVYHATNSGKPIMVFMNPGETWSVVFHKMPQTKLLVLLLGWSMAGAVASLAVGVDVELVAHRVADEVKGKKKVTFADIVSATKSVGMKAFGGKAPSMDTITQIMQATDQLSGGGGGGSADGEIGTAIGDLAKTSEAISGDGPKKPLSNTVGDVTSASTHSSPTKTTPGSRSSRGSQSSTASTRRV